MPDKTAAQCKLQWFKQFSHSDGGPQTTTGTYPCWRGPTIGVSLTMLGWCALWLSGPARRAVDPLKESLGRRGTAKRQRQLRTMLEQVRRSRCRVVVKVLTGGVLVIVLSPCTQKNAGHADDVFAATGLSRRVGSSRQGTIKIGAGGIVSPSFDVSWGGAPRDRRRRACGDSDPASGANNSESGTSESESGSSSSSSSDGARSDGGTSGSNSDGTDDSGASDSDGSDLDGSDSESDSTADGSTGQRRARFSKQNSQLDLTPVSVMAWWLCGSP